MEFGENKEQERCYSGNTKREKDSQLCYIDGHLSSLECRVGTKTPKYKGGVVLRRDIVRDDSGA